MSNAKALAAIIAESYSGQTFSERGEAEAWLTERLEGAIKEFVSANIPNLAKLVEANAFAEAEEEYLAAHKAWQPFIYSSEADYVNEKEWEKCRDRLAEAQRRKTASFKEWQQWKEQSANCGKLPEATP